MEHIRIAEAGAAPAAIASAMGYCTGFGQYHTHGKFLSNGKPNKRPQAGEPYPTITGRDIANMVRNPPSLPKEKAQWFIPSTLAECEARSHEVQQERGEFWWLTLDEDGDTGNNLSLQEVDEAIVSVCGDVVRFIYSTRSSTPLKKKWRALIPLAYPLPGTDFADTQEAFFDLLQMVTDGTLIPDRALSRPGQLVYLPNKGEHYEQLAVKAPEGRLELSPQSRIMVRREGNRERRETAERMAKAARDTRRARARTAGDGDSVGIVEAFNNATTVEAELERAGYARLGRGNDWRSPYQTSKSFATRCFGDYWITLSASDAAAGLGATSGKSGARFGDAFDLFCHFEHGGNFAAAVRGYAQHIGKDFASQNQLGSFSKETASKTISKGSVPDKPRKLSNYAEKLAWKVAKDIQEIVKSLDLEDGATIQADVAVEVIDDMISGAFWSGAKSKMFLLNEDETLLQFAKGDAWHNLCRRFGAPIDESDILRQIEAASGKKIPKDTDKAIKAAAISPILRHLQYHNQRERVEWMVDMFADQSRVELREGDGVKIVLTHKALDVRDADKDPRIVADYKEHFPEIDEALRFIVASRFAANRKKSYLWMLMPSDWGKGLFMGLLKDHGLVVEMSVKEIEAVFEGKPASRGPEDFRRAIVLTVDEFKSVKSEIKQLESEINLAPKYQLVSSVPLFTKIFMSAENVPSLVGEAGVEDQFANRMSMLSGKGTIEERPIYSEDPGRYYRALRAYVGETLNRLIGEYQSLGQSGAERRAGEEVNAFWGKHGLGVHFQRLSAGYASIADEALEWIYDYRSMDLIRPDDGYVYLKNAANAVSAFLRESYDMSELSTISRRRGEIMQHMSADGQGSAAHRVGGVVRRTIKLKPKPKI